QRGARPVTAGDGLWTGRRRARRIVHAEKTRAHRALSGPGALAAQAAEVSRAACHTIQTKPPHDASDNRSRAQRDMTSLRTYVPGMFYVLDLFSSRGGVGLRGRCYGAAREDRKRV